MKQHASIQAHRLEGRQQPASEPGSSLPAAACGVCSTVAARLACLLSAADASTCCSAWLARSSTKAAVCWESAAAAGDVARPGPAVCAARQQNAGWWHDMLAAA